MILLQTNLLSTLFAACHNIKEIHIYFRTILTIRYLKSLIPADTIPSIIPYKHINNSSRDRYHIFFVKFTAIQSICQMKTLGSTDQQFSRPDTNCIITTEIQHEHAWAVHPVLLYRTGHT
jgi:hypothetical protein